MVLPLNTHTHTHTLIYTHKHTHTYTPKNPGIWRNLVWDLEERGREERKEREKRKRQIKKMNECFNDFIIHIKSQFP